MIGGRNNFTGNRFKKRTKSGKYCLNAMKSNNVKINVIFLIFYQNMARWQINPYCNEYLFQINQVQVAKQIT